MESGSGRRARWRRWAGPAALAMVALLALPFALYAARFGASGLATDLAGTTYLHTPGDWRPNLGIFLHMLSGAAITVLAPLQLVPAVRRRWPGVHRASGYALAALALLTALGGLLFIALRGTIGGPPMDLAFAAYGALLLLAACEAPRHARHRDWARHRRWALRLAVLALGSWLYRLHYALWYAATGGLASEPDFSGAFDQVALWAFFLPYLLALEGWLRREGRRGGLARPEGA